MGLTRTIDNEPADEEGLQRTGLKPVKVLLSAAVMVVAVAMVSVTSLALFTDSASVGANAFSTGTIDITAAPATAVVTMPAMAPGDQVTSPLDVGNAGSLELRYALSSVSTENVLASELVLTVKSGVVACDDTNWASTGTTLYAGPLGSTAELPILGSSNPGADVGDRVLSAGVSETLCLNVSLPISSTTGQGITTTATLNFIAEQTANNP